MKYFSILLLGLFISSHSFSQNNEAENTVKGMFNALAELNIEKMKSYCTKDIMIIENGQVWNMDTLVLKIAPSKPDSTFKRTNHFDFINTKIDGNTAWTCYYQEASGTAHGRPFRVKWIESVILNKEQGQWKIRFLHSTPVK